MNHPSVLATKEFKMTIIISFLCCSWGAAYILKSAFSKQWAKPHLMSDAYQTALHGTACGGIRKNSLLF